ncbi:ATP-binding protein [Kitasatospora sp. NPDC088783]|uniref:ATP-binding protein n=1 Tax=Kitasatospora sp. NPDC088783 TaxID=3364077 RepID=UPI0037F4F61C
MTDTASSLGQVKLGRRLEHRRVPGTELGDKVAAAARDAALVFLASAEPECLDSVLLVIAELVTNAAIHGCGLVDLVMCRHVHGITVAVRDRDERVETLQFRAKQAVRSDNDMEGWSVDAVLAAIGEGGRGLLLVEKTATAWDVRRCPGGKTVRAAFAYPEAAAS